MQNLVRARHRGAAAADRTPDRPYEFSLGRIGNPTSAALLLVVAVCLALSPLFLPDPLTPRLVVASVRELGAFRINNAPNEGLFTASDRSGDTRPSQSATATAIAAYALAAPEWRVPTSKALQNFATILIFNNTVLTRLQDIMEGAIIARGAGVLDGDALKKLQFDLHVLREQGSGYRSDNDHSATMTATAQTITTLDTIDRLNLFVKSAAFPGVKAFVLSMKDVETGGFRDAAYSTPSVTSTYDALSVLRHLPRDEMLAALNGTEAFIFSCQAQDGGFRNVPRPPAPAKTNAKGKDNTVAAQDIVEEESDVATTAKAVYLLQFFEENSVPTNEPQPGQASLFAMARSAQNAADYLRSCLSLSHGVRQSYSSKRRSLEGTLLFLRLANDFRSLKLGIPPSLPSVLLALAALAATGALLMLYAPQLAGPVYYALVQRSVVLLLLLSVSVALLGYAPLASLFGFIPLGFFLAMRFYEASEQDTQDGLSLLCATINGMVVAGAVYAFNRWAPLLWLQLRAYTTITLLFAAASYIATLGVCYFNGMRRMQISLNGAVMSWIVSQAILYGWVFGRADSFAELTYRTLGAHGNFPLVFWALPFLSWLAALATAALATYTVAFFTGRVKSQ